MQTYETLSIFQTLYLENIVTWLWNGYEMDSVVNTIKLIVLNIEHQQTYNKMSDIENKESFVHW